MNATLTQHKMNTCNAIVHNGIHAGRQCKKRSIYGADKCRPHEDSLKKHGPNAIAKLEASAKFKFDNNNLEFEYKYKLISFDEFNKTKQNIQNTYDEAINSIQDIDDIDYLKEWRMNKQIRRIHRLNGEMFIFEPQNINDDIRVFVNDKQNVHTKVIVDQSIEIIKRIREISVPQEYQWNKTKCSKTPADIILNWNLTPQASFQMMLKYCSDETVYESEDGIYGKVLDGVWQFIIASSDKECLIKILKQELDDNIGMCAQGNLSRLCNVVVGYIDNIKVKVNPIEELARLLPPLMEIEDKPERIREAKKILNEVGIVPEKWNDWLIALE